jgi:chromosome segregation ATPase
VVPGGAPAARCTTATKTLKRLRRSLKKLDRRIHKLRKRISHTDTAKKREAEVRHLKKLRKRRQKMAHRKHQAAHLVALSCGAAK